MNSSERIAMRCVLVAFAALLVALAGVHWWHHATGAMRFILIGLSACAEAVLFFMATALASTKGQPVRRTVAILFTLVVACVEGAVLLEPVSAVAANIIPRPAITVDPGQVREGLYPIEQMRADIRDAQAKRDVDALQVAIGAVDQGLLADFGFDGVYGEETRQAASLALAQLARDAAPFEAQRETLRLEQLAAMRWLIVPIIAVVVLVLFELCARFALFGHEAPAGQHPAQQPEYPTPAYTAEDFALGRIPARTGCTRVGHAPSDRYPLGRVVYDPRGGSDTEEQYAEKARAMRVRLGYEKPALRVVR